MDSILTQKFTYWIKSNFCSLKSDISNRLAVKFLPQFSASRHDRIKPVRKSLKLWKQNPKSELTYPPSLLCNKWNRWTHTPPPPPHTHTCFRFFLKILSVWFFPSSFSFFKSIISLVWTFQSLLSAHWFFSKMTDLRPPFVLQKSNTMDHCDSSIEFPPESSWQNESISGIRLKSHLSSKIKCWNS